MFFIFLIFCGGVYYLYTSLWGSGVNNTSKYELFIATGSSYNDVISHLQGDNILKSPYLFDLLADQMNYKKDKVKSGKYTIAPKMSIRHLISNLRSGNQSAIDITFNNIRTIEELAGRLSHQIEPDSMSLLNTLIADLNVTSKGFTRESVGVMYIPNTYQVYWNITPQQLVNRMQKEYKIFWSHNNRKSKAKAKNITPIQASILGSIVQKETNKKPEQSIVAGVYLNRIRIGMPLQADPTVVFGIGDFTIKRVLNKHLEYKSPYNTYLNKGLPPGPICIAESTAIDAVLDAEDSGYLYFCAKPGYRGGHLFAKDLTAHNKNARIYHRWLSKEGIMK